MLRKFYDLLDIHSDQQTSLEIEKRWEQDCQDIE